MGNSVNITVFGATGRIGKELTGLLSQANVPVTAVTRDRSKAMPMPFVEWVEADMADKESLHKVMEDSKAVFLLSGHSNNFVAEQNNVIEAAKTYHVKHIVKLSSGGVDKNSPFYIPDSHIGKVHGDVEALLKASAISYTILQPNGFMQNWLGDLSQTVKQERKIYEATGEGKRAYLDIRDIGEVAFEALINPEQHAGKTYLLTGPEAVNFGQVAAAISSVIGEKVTFVPLTTDEARERMERKGLPPLAVQSLLTYAAAQRNGHTSFVSDAVEKILHKPARTMQTFVKDYAAWFQ